MRRYDPQFALWALIFLAVLGTIVTLTLGVFHG